MGQNLLQPQGVEKTREPEEVVAEAQSTILPDESSKGRSWAVPTAFVLVVVALPLITYVALINDWAAPVAGVIYTEDEYQRDLDGARETSFTAGESQGYDTGHQVGWDAGKAEGTRVGFEYGRVAGHEAGLTEGYDSGYAEGRASGAQAGFDAGYASGLDEGHAQGVEEGYEEGFEDGCLVLFDNLGTDRVGDWWDYYYSPSYASYYDRTACTYLSLFTYRFTPGR